MKHAQLGLHERGCVDVYGRQILVDDLGIHLLALLRPLILEHHHFLGTCLRFLAICGTYEAVVFLRRPAAGSIPAPLHQPALLFNEVFVVVDLLIFP